MIKYIKDAQSKIKSLKKREKKKQKEGEEHKDEKSKEDLAITTVKKSEKDLKLQELEELRKYFEKLLPEEKKEEIKVEAKQPETQSNQPGKLKRIEKVEVEIGCENYTKSKKKGKKPKEPQGSRKKQSKKVGLTLDFEMLQKISDSGLSAPTKIEDIPTFLKNLEKRQEGIKSGQISLEVKKEEPQTPKEEPQTKNRY